VEICSANSSYGVTFVIYSVIFRNIWKNSESGNGCAEMTRISEITTYKERAKRGEGIGEWRRRNERRREFSG
jgi:hypothetical protein